MKDSLTTVFFALVLTTPAKACSILDMKLKLCFDCDDTLYDLSWPFRMSASHLFADGQLDPIDMERFYLDYRKAGDEIFDQIQTGKISIDESGRHRIKTVCSRYGIPVDDAFANEFQKMYRDYQKNIAMDPQLVDFFQETDADLAILTNGDHGHQYAKLSTLGVFDYFHPSHVFTSGKIGFAKPDPRAFTEVMDTLNENAMDWYYIGDSYGNDMEGAKNVGMKTIHFNRHHGPEGEAADYVVYSEKQLIELLKELSA